MALLCVLLLLPALAISFPLTWLLIRLGHRLQTYDSPGVPGQVKVAAARTPNTGGVAVFCGVALPMLAGLIALAAVPAETISRIAPSLAPHLAGIRERAPMAAIVLAGATVLHIMGLIDDRRPMRALPKLALMLGVAAAVSITTGSRLLTMLDAHVGGPWLSYGLSVLWIVAVTNAMNFLDNMDGLSAGVATIAASFFLAGTLASPQPQWFIAATLALMIGSLIGFLAFNAPRPDRDTRARIFLGDGGSLVVGYLLAFLTIRTTFVTPEPGSSGDHPGGWYGVLMPLVVLAIPLYDFTSVVIIRLRQGKSPFVGDLQHVSHRLVERGLSRRGAVYVLWGLTAITGVGGVSLATLAPWQAALVGGQTALILVLLWAFEHASRRMRFPLDGSHGRPTPAPHNRQEQAR